MLGAWAVARRKEPTSIVGFGQYVHKEKAATRRRSSQVSLGRSAPED
jgi:hypothetical protein